MRIPQDVIVPKSVIEGVCCNRATEAARRALKLVPGYIAPAKQHSNIGIDALLRVGFRTRSSFRLDGGDASLVPARHVIMLLSGNASFWLIGDFSACLSVFRPPTEHAEAKLATDHLV